MNEYKALSVEHPVKVLFGSVLSVYSSGLDQTSQLSDLSWLSSSLVNSASLKKSDRVLNLLKEKILSFKADDSQNLTVDQGIGLIMGLKALADAGLMNESSLKKYMRYFDKVAGTSWFRVREVAALFCHAFSGFKSFSDLVGKAKDYLSSEFGKNHNPVGVTLFGLSRTGNVDGLISPDVEATIRQFLDSKVSGVEELSYLCLALKDSENDGLKQEAFNKFLGAINEQLYQLTSENSEVISLLLAILYISASENDGSQILEKLKRSNIKEDTKKRVYEILKFNNTLQVSFRDSNPVDPPIFKSVAVSLFALTQTQLSQAYLFNRHLKSKIEAFLRSTGDSSFKLVSTKFFYVILLTFDAVAVYFAFNVWWPLFDSIFSAIDGLQGSVWKFILDSFAGLGFILPLYMLLNINWGVIEKGYFTFSGLFDITLKRILKLTGRLFKR
jgi:hypothetical protein